MLLVLDLLWLLLSGLSGLVAVVDGVELSTGGLGNCTSSDMLEELEALLWDDEGDPMVSCEMSG